MRTRDDAAGGRVAARRRRATPGTRWSGDGSPFLEWDWLVGARGRRRRRAAARGWLPQHLTLWDGERLVGACPLYVKAHSQGEFVFDHGWARPRTARASRTTRSCWSRCRSRRSPARASWRLPASTPRVAPVARRRCSRRSARAQGFSSVHVNFCLDDDRAVLEARGWLRRTGYQYHWTNRGFRTFDDYLGSLRSKRRNQVRRERASCEAQGVAIEALVGERSPTRSCRRRTGSTAPRSTPIRGASAT